MTTSLTFIASGGGRKQRDLAAFLTADIQERAHVEANAWIKRLRLVRYGSRTMRERFMYRDESLWWFTELYLHRMRRLDRAVATVLALDLAIAGEGPARMVICGGDETVAAAARAVANARGLPIDVEHTAAAPSRTSHESRLIGVTARLSRWRLGRAITPRRATVAAFVHTAFWRASHGADAGGEEGYIGPVLDAVAERLPHEALALVGVGPRRNFRARRWWDPVANGGHAPASITPIEKLAPMRSIASALAFWRERRVLADDIVSGDDIRSAALFESCDLWEILARDLRETALLQWPWSARAMDEAGAALDALQPAVAVTYAEAGGWGRALMIEARRRGIRSVGVQHGFIYRHWLNYQHEVDELQTVDRDRGAPIPDCTLLFDRYAEEGLTAHGHYPPDHLIVTGNARLDVLASRVHAMTTAERDAARRYAGGTPDRPFALLAAKFSEIRDVLPAFVRAVAAEPTLQVAIKAHPAETPAVYAPFLDGAANIRVIGPGADLAPLIAGADAILTMNSTVALDGLALGVPALVIGLPSNLSPFVDAGVMAGSDGTEASIREGLRGVLYDQEIRRQLLSRAEIFLGRHGMRPSGRAAERAADVIVEAGSRS